jgi:uncharacterized protein
VGRVGIVRPVLVVLIVLAVVAALLAVLSLGQRRLIYLPDRAAPVPTESMREAILQTSDGLRLVAWLAPPTRGDRELAVLVAPGNAGHRGHRAPLAAALADSGFTVLLLDYRGYGGNPGSPSEQGLALDVRAALAYLTSTGGFSLDRIIYFGESLGGAVVTELATEHRPAGLVLRSPFIDLATTAQRLIPFLPVRRLLRDRFPLAELLATVPVPTIVVYSDADRIVLSNQSRIVAERAAGPVRVIEVERAGHNDVELVSGTQVIDAVVELAERVSA